MRIIFIHWAILFHSEISWNEFHFFRGCGEFSIEPFPAVSLNQHRNSLHFISWMMKDTKALLFHFPYCLMWFNNILYHYQLQLNWQPFSIGISFKPWNIINSSAFMRSSKFISRSITFNQWYSGFQSADTVINIIIITVRWNNIEHENQLLQTCCAVYIIIIIFALCVNVCETCSWDDSGQWRQINLSELEVDRRVKN